jgi:predicted small secreted protein
MNRISRQLVLSVIIGSSLVLLGCRTMHGLGEDISSGGKALANAAEPSKKSGTAKTETTKSSTTSSSK